MGWRSTTFAGVACLAAALAWAPGAHAQDDDPNRSIHVVVPYPAGGIIDIVARTVVEQIGRTLKQSIVMEARPGADSNAGTAAVAHGAPDGYTWLVTGPAVLVNPTLYKDTGWEPLRDFKCVGLVVWNKSVAVVPPSLHVKTMAELVALARSKPGELNFSSPGTGTSNEFTAQEFFQAAGIKLATVGYKGQPPALSDLGKNLVQFGIISLALALPAIKDGTVTPLAVFTDKRLPQIPNVPTIAEAGYPAATYLPWYGIYVPAATPEPVVERINRAINEALETPSVHRKLAVADIPGKPMQLDELEALMRSDFAKLTAVAKAGDQGGH
jgi:tripartite-type tricarboxylate transporter receptor subunit TctC